MSTHRLSGLVAATYTPFNDDGSLALSKVGPMVEHLIEAGNQGLYVCGSTGEGVSLTTAERCEVAEAYVQAAAGRVPVFVQVGHNSVEEAKHLAAHAQQIGADAVSATCPSYFKANDEKTLLKTIKSIASAAPSLPFYYYHIPVLTGSSINIVSFMQAAGDAIPNLFGLKYTDTKLHEFQQCLEIGGGRYDVVWGTDEMMLGALATGAKAGIGSTYNVIAPTYLKMLEAFNAHRMEEARALQMEAIGLIRILGRYPFHSAMKELLNLLGHDMGTCRLPQRGLTSDETEELRGMLQSVGCLGTLAINSTRDRS
ncbi:dihydrodipicolinate synthase family protein [Bremerella sp. JC770]|uniref:dihydrodipicolinate synthase family protein n=1 Tax=Bremerella sp. JC770 TaxID=3232137 RepID=UPI00345A857D